MAEVVAPPPTPKAGEVSIDVARLGSDDIAEVGDALAGLFAEEDGAQEIQQEGATAQPADTEQEEIPAIGNTEDGHSEQPEGAAIEPPLTWTAEEKQAFIDLPPEAKAALAPFMRRESERERLTSTQAQKTAEATQRLEAARQQVDNDRAQQVMLLQSVLYQLTPDLQRFQTIDWNKLAAEKPAEWAQQRQAFDDLTMRWNLAQQQIVGIQGQARQEQENQHQTFLASEKEKLVAKVPEFADPAKAKAFVEDVAKFMPELTQAELQAVADHRQILILREALQYRKAIAAKAAAQTKRTLPAPASNVRQLRPTARPASGAVEEAKTRQLAALHDNLRRAGTTQNAADLLVATGIFGKN